MQVSVAFSRQKHLYSIDHAKYFFTFNLEKKQWKDSIQVSISSAHNVFFSCVLAEHCVSAGCHILPLRPHIDFWRYQLRQRTHFMARIPFCMTLKKWHGQISWSLLYCSNRVKRLQRKWIVHVHLFVRGHVFPQLCLSAYTLDFCGWFNTLKFGLSKTIIRRVVISQTSHGLPLAHSERWLYAYLLKNEQMQVLHSQTIMMKFNFSSHSGQELST